MQFGFRQNRNTSDATFVLLEHINEILEQEQIPLRVLCDLSKAFDCVDHTVLINKLDYYRVRGTQLK